GQRHAAHSRAALGCRRRFRADCSLSGERRHAVHDGARLRHRWRLYVVLDLTDRERTEMLKILAAPVAIALLLATAALAQQPAKPAAPTVPGEDRYIGYYYPRPTSTETFTSSMQTVAGVERAQRIQFVTVVSQGTIQSAYRVPYAVFAKGEKADKLIIVGLQPGEFSTV